MTDLKQNDEQSAGKGAEPAIAHEHDLFISFTARDTTRPIFGRRTNIVIQSKRALEAFRHPDTGRRFRVCTFDEDFELQDELEPAITQTIDRSLSVLVLCTHDAAASHYVQLELAYAIKAKPSDRLLAGVVDAAPADLFPSIFPLGSLGADFSVSGLNEFRSWKKRLQIECAKVAARVWGLRVLELYDRFVEERRRRFRRIAAAFAVIIATLAAASGTALYNFYAAENARKSALDRRYVADLLSVDRAWNTGDVKLAQTFLKRHDSPETDDRRTFEWYTFKRILTSERSGPSEWATSAKASAIAARLSLMAISTEDKPTAIFNPKNGAIVATLSSATKDAQTLAFSGDNSRLIVGGVGELRVWMMDDGEEVVFMLPSAGQVTSLAMHPTSDDGMLVDENGQVFHFRVDTGDVKKLFRIETPFGLVPQFQIVYAEDGRSVFVASLDEKVRVIDATNFAVRDTLTLNIGLWGTSAASGGVLLLPTGNHVAVLDTATTSVVRSNYMGNIVSTIGVRHDAKMVAIGGAWGSIELWQTPVLTKPSTWRYVGALKGFKGWPSAAHFVPGTPLLVATTTAGNVKVWDWSQATSNSILAHDQDVSAARFLGRTGDIISMDADGMVKRWNLNSGNVEWKRQLKGEYQNSTLVIDEAGDTTIAAGSGPIVLVNTATGEIIEKQPGFAPIARSSDGEITAWLNADQVSINIRSRTRRANQMVRLREPPKGSEYNLDVVSLAVSPTGDIVVAGTSSGTIQVIDVKRSLVETEKQLSESIIWSLDFSPNGLVLAAGASDNLIHIINAPDWSEISTLSGHSGRVRALDFTPDGKTLASGGEDGVIRYWNTATWQETILNSAHSADYHPGIQTLHFNPSGDTLISGGAQGRVIVWSADRPSTAARLAISR